MRNLFDLDPCVQRVTSQRVFDLYGTVGDAGNGCFTVTRRSRGAMLRFVVVVSTDDDWEHLSVSLKQRTPTWEEMAWIAELFFYPEERLVQYRPPAAEYVNMHPHCLHWWRSVRLTMPAPDPIAVGMLTDG